MYSYVFQDVFLFSNTIKSNIAYSRPDIDERMVTKVTTYTQATKFIDALADHYKTIVGERVWAFLAGRSSVFPSPRSSTRTRLFLSWMTPLV